MKRLQLGACLGGLIMEPDLDLLAGLRQRVLASDCLSWGMDPLQALVAPDQLPSWEGQALLGFFAEEEQWRQACSRGRLVVNLVDDQPMRRRTAMVGQDDELVGRMAAEHLAELRPERFLYFGYEGRRGMAARRRGFRAAVAEFGAECSELIVPLEERNGDLQDRLHTWLHEARRDRLGIFACSDRLAARVLSYCSRAGMAVPERVQVLGCGNLSPICELSDLPISSIILNWRRVGEESADALIRLHRGEAPPPLRLPPLGVEVRTSTDPASHSDAGIQAALRCIRKRLAEPLRVEDVCVATGIGRRSLERRFAEHLGRGIREEIERLRFLRAGELLRGSDWPLERIARGCGLSGAQALQTLFRRRGAPPPGLSRS
jgi:LacI family transcriptional regulator